MWRCVDLVRTDVSDERIASTLRVEKTRKRNQQRLQIAATCSRWFLARGFFYLEDGSDTFLRKVGSHKIYTAAHPGRRHSS
jgi:hypothetical protein